MISENSGTGSVTPIWRIATYDRTMIQGIKRMAGAYQIFALARPKSKDLFSKPATPTGPHKIVKPVVFA